MSGRCRACNCILSDEEMTIKIPNTNTYQDLCFVCTAKSTEDVYEDDLLYLSSSIEEFPESLE